MKPFRPQVFLFRMLAAVFMWEGLLLAYSFWACSHPTLGAETRVLQSERCPRLGQRAENVFEIAIATTLSLLAGGNQFSLRSSASGPDASASPRPPQPLPSLPEGNSRQAKARGKARGKAQESAQVQE